MKKAPLGERFRGSLLTKIKLESGCIRNTIASVSDESAERVLIYKLLESFLVQSYSKSSSNVFRVYLKCFSS